MNIEAIILAQKKFFFTNQTKHTDFRISQLKKLKTILKENENLIYEAVYKDLGKSKFEVYASELSLIYHEINTCLKKIKKWSKRKRVATNLANFPSKSFIIPEPLGNTLIIAPWNYPIQLAISPAVAAISAGNTVILKPSEIAKNSSTIIAKLINENFDQSFFTVIEGGVEITTNLLAQKFDKIFFTGSTHVGKIVYQAAAKNLTPVVLELGGKSPTFVLKDCNLKMTVKRLVWAKFLNAGQSCIAPDYILVHQAIEKKFLETLKAEIETNYNLTDDISDNFNRIINAKNYTRLISLLEKTNIYFGGKTNKNNRFISPTILQNCSFEDEIMKDEIFGPILPVITFSNLDDVIKKVKSGEKPLACYVYSKNKKSINKILNELSFGNGAINESVMQLTNSKLPFGGVGASGIGSYHGKNGFKTFSHYKSILSKPTWLELNLKYAPYTNWKLKILKFLLE
jgi:aldehyde dehydrogenase (NAD+)